MAAKRQKELVAIISEWLDEDDVDLSGLLVQQNDDDDDDDDDDESDTMPIVTIEKHLTFPWEDDGS